jgi:hypothetical protein
MHRILIWLDIWLILKPEIGYPVRPDTGYPSGFSDENSKLINNYNLQ